MAWKINKITIENFKYFLDPFTIEPEGKNVLIYGENGSGKSSIYWAAYTHFQSSIKNQQDASKYFDKNHTDSLRNLYDDGARESGIEIEFINEFKLKKSFTDGTRVINTNVPGDDFMKLTTFASDFMNYKFLSAIFDFKNSARVNLFSIFESEIFPFISLSGQCRDLYGNALGTSVDTWWKYIKECYTSGKLSKRSADGNVYKHDDRYQAYQNLIKDFNDKLQVLLTEISDATNSRLRDSNMPIAISLELTPVVFDKRIETKRRAHDGKFYTPEIILKARLLNANGVQVSDKEILHPRSFFNEAKLTRLALSLRLAIFDRKYKSDNCAQVFFVDDLLISLDMSNRLLVVQQLLEYVDKYQLFIFTHDRSFYDLISDSISQRGQRDQWNYYEMYAIDEDISRAKVPHPIIKSQKDYIQQACIFFSNYDYHTSANSLRKECEAQLDRLYPQNWTICIKSDGTSSKINLNGLIQKLSSFYERYNITNIPTPNLDQYRKRILNPGSHNDNSAQIYRSELILAINEISKLSSISKSCISDTNDIGNRSFIMTLDNDVQQVEIEFMPQEVWNKLSFDGVDYYEGIDIDCTNTIGIKLKQNKNHNIYSVWEQVCKSLWADSNKYPSIDTVIKDKSTGQLLKDIHKEL
jgi:energy-coupling factor transporter ATP-binding protein EcfA2